MADEVDNYRDIDAVLYERFDLHKQVNHGAMPAQVD